MQPYTFKPVSNYAHTAKEVSTNSTPEAFVREVVVHNTYDADATWIRAAPLVGTDVVGVLVADNGHGMSRPAKIYFSLTCFQKVGVVIVEGL